MTQKMTQKILFFSIRRVMIVSLLTFACVILLSNNTILTFAQSVNRIDNNGASADLVTDSTGQFAGITNCTQNAGANSIAGSINCSGIFLQDYDSRSSTVPTQKVLVKFSSDDIPALYKYSQRTYKVYMPSGQNTIYIQSDITGNYIKLTQSDSQYVELAQVSQNCRALNIPPTDTKCNFDPNMSTGSQLDNFFSANEGLLRSPTVAAIKDKQLTVGQRNILAAGYNKARSIQGGPITKGDGSSLFCTTTFDPVDTLKVDLVYKCTQSGKKMNPFTKVELDASCNSDGWFRIKGTSGNETVECLSQTDATNATDNQNKLVVNSVTSSKSLTDRLANTTSDIGTYIIKLVIALVTALLYVINWGLLTITWLILMIFVFLIRLNPAGTSFYPVVLELWKLFVSVANFILFLSFPFAGIVNVLGLKQIKINLNQFFQNVVIVAIGINFTILGAAAVINVAQGVGDIMIYSYIADKDTPTIKDDNIKVSNALVGNFINSIGQASTYRCGTSDAAQKGCTVAKPSNGTTGGIVDFSAITSAVNGFGAQISGTMGQAITSLVMEAIFTVIMAITIINVAPIMWAGLTRFVQLVMFMIGSPVVLASMFSQIPRLSGFGRTEINRFIANVTYYPVAVMFFVALSVFIKSFNVVLAKGISLASGGGISVLAASTDGVDITKVIAPAILVIASVKAIEIFALFTKTTLMSFSEGVGNGIFNLASQKTGGGQYGDTNTENRTAGMNGKLATKRGLIESLRTAVGANGKSTGVGRQVFQAGANGLNMGINAVKGAPNALKNVKRNLQNTRVRAIKSISNLSDGIKKVPGVVSNLKTKAQVTAMALGATSSLRMSNPSPTQIAASTSNTPTNIRMGATRRRNYFQAQKITYPADNTQTSTSFAPVEATMFGNSSSNSTQTSTPLGSSNSSTTSAQRPLNNRKFSFANDLNTGAYSPLGPASKQAGYKFKNSDVKQAPELGSSRNTRNTAQSSNQNTQTSKTSLNRPVSSGTAPLKTSGNQPNLSGSINTNTRDNEAGKLPTRTSRGDNTQNENTIPNKKQKDELYSGAFEVQHEQVTGARSIPSGIKQSIRPKQVETSHAVSKPDGYSSALRQTQPETTNQNPEKLPTIQTKINPYKTENTQSDVSDSSAKYSANSPVITSGQRSRETDNVSQNYTPPTQTNFTQTNQSTSEPSTLPIRNVNKPFTQENVRQSSTSNYSQTPQTPASYNTEPTRSNTMESRSTTQPKHDFQQPENSFQQIAQPTTQTNYHPKQANSTTVPNRANNIVNYANRPQNSEPTNFRIPVVTKSPSGTKPPNNSSFATTTKK